MQIGLNMSLSGLRTLDPAASVRALFANDEPGGWFEANDSTTLFTDVAGTTPVTAPGDAVALQLDKSQGLTLGPELNADLGFDVPVSWTTNNGGQGTVEVTGGKVVATSAGNGALVDRNMNETLLANKFYEITYTIDSISGGGVRFFNRVTVGLTRTSPGTYTEIFKGTSDRTTGGFQFLNNGVSAVIDNLSVRELPGNHRTQATTAARPLYALHPVGGVRNKLEYTEDYSEWFSNAAGGEEFDAIAPDGTPTALKVMFGTAANEIFAPPATISITGQTVLGFFAKADSARPLTVSATVGGTPTTGYFTGANLTSDWQFFELPKDSGADEITQIRFQNTGTTEERTVPVYVWHPQLEVGSTATNYQRVGSFLDVSEEGKARRGRLWYNGTSHFMQTGTITPGTDKVQVFAGVRNLNIAVNSVIVENSTNSFTSDGTVQIATDSVGRYIASSKGTVRQTARTSSGLPINTSVVANLSDISGDTVTLRIDGTQVNQSTADQGTGNYLAYPIYFGARGGATLFFNGYEDTSIIRFGPNLDDTTISKVESYVASKTPEATL